MAAGKIVILGKNGQLGRALLAQERRDGHGAEREQVDLLKPVAPQLDEWLGITPVAALINASAYTAVDKAEGEGQRDAWRINAEAPGELAAWAKARKIPFIHFSTDYVFDGSGNEPRSEDAPIAPVNEYGRGKAAGEKAVMDVGGNATIFRTSWVYDDSGKNFFTTMLRLMREREELSVVNDQIGAPTYAPHLASATLAALEKLGSNTTPAIYHLCGSGATSWHGFASAILSLASLRDSGIKCGSVKPIPSSAYPLPAPRPLNSRLNCSKAADAFNVMLPNWEQGLKKCLDAHYGNSRLPD